MSVPTAMPPGPLEAAALAAALCAALVAPGWMAQRILVPRTRGAAALGLAVGLSAAIWPVGLVWISMFGLRAGRAAAVAAVAISAAVAVAWPYRSGIPVLGPKTVEPAGRSTGRPTRLPRLGLVDWAALGLTLATLALRVWQARGVVVPPWVDGLHHTVVTQRILEAGGLPDSLRPYIPFDRFYYHVGFHALAAVVAWLSGASAPAAVLWTGQALSAVAPLTLLALARPLTGKAEGGLAAAMVPATLYWFPSYFLAWSRYTELDGLVTLPVAWLLVWRAATAPKPLRPGMAAALTAAGLALVHYRVIVVYALSALVLAIWRLAGMSGPRSSPRGPLAGLGRVGLVAACAIALTGPWWPRLLAGARALSGTPKWFAGPSEIEAVPDFVLTAHGNAWWLALAAVGLLAAVLLGPRRRALAAVAVLGLTYAAARPGSVVPGAPSTWLLPPFSVAIAAFVPAGIGVGFLAAGAVRSARRDRRPAASIRRLGVALTLAVASLGAFEPGPAGARWRVQPQAVVNPVTEIARRADVVAAAWIRRHTPVDARFVVAAAPWHLGTFRGIDGGYWLPVLASRGTQIPGALYPYGDAAEVGRITSLAARTARGDALSDSQISALLDDAGAQYLYVGPAGDGMAEKLSQTRLARHPALRLVYAGGGVAVFQRAAGSSLR